MKFFRDILTGIDGQTYDAGRVGLLLAVLTFLGCAIWQTYKGGAFDYQGFGIGFSALLAGGGAGIALKAKTEPGGQ